MKLHSNLLSAFLAGLLILGGAACGQQAQEEGGPESRTTETEAGEQGATEAQTETETEGEAEPEASDPAETES